MQYHGDRDRRTAPDDGARKRTVRRLMVVRLRVEIATREAAQPSDPRIEESTAGASCADGSEPGHGLTGARRLPLGRRWRFGGLLFVHQDLVQPATGR